MFPNYRVVIDWQLSGQLNDTKTSLYFHFDSPRYSQKSILNNIVQIQLRSIFEISNDIAFRKCEIISREQLLDPKVITVDTSSLGNDYRFPEHIRQACISKIIASDFEDLQALIHFDNSENRQPLMPDVFVTDMHKKPVVEINPPIYFNDCSSVRIRIEKQNSQLDRVKLGIVYQIVIPLKGSLLDGLEPEFPGSMV